MSTVNVKLGNNTLTGVDTVKLESASEAGSYYSFQYGTALDKTVHFISADADYAIQSVPTGAQIAAPVHPPVRPGYQFKGWGTSASATTFRTFPYTPTLDNETLYAVWVSGSKTTITGWGSSSPSSVVISKESTFPTSFEDWTDENGNIFVKIPTMYRKVLTVPGNQITSSEIATAQIDSSYEPYSVFVKPNGDVMPYVCIGKYCASATNVCNSVNASKVTQAIGNGRTNARAWGTGYQLYDWQFQKLFQDLCVAIKGTVNFQPGTSTISEYIGVKHLDGGVWVDGVAKDGTTWRFAMNPENYVDSPTTGTTGYVGVSYSAPSLDGEVQKIGYDASHPFFNYPSAVTSNSSFNTYYCDGYYYATGNRPVSSNVGNAIPIRGLFYWGVNYDWTDSNGVRLCYRPL